MKLLGVQQQEHPLPVPCWFLTGSRLTRPSGAGVAWGRLARTEPGRLWARELTSFPPLPDTSRTPVPSCAPGAARRLQMALRRRPGRWSGGRGWSSAREDLSFERRASGERGWPAKGERGRQNPLCPGVRCYPHEVGDPETLPAMLTHRFGASSGALLKSFRLPSWLRRARDSSPSAKGLQFRNVFSLHGLRS